MKQKIALVGAGGLGKEVLTILRSMEDLHVIGFFDDGIASNVMVMGLPILGDIQVLNTWNEPIQVLIAIGDPRIKKEVTGRITNSKVRYATVIHPSVMLGEPDSIKIGEGSILAAGAALTVDIEIGKHVLVNLNSTIGHDVKVGDYTSIMPGANLAGLVKLGNGVLIGSGANIINQAVIGNHAIIGSGAVVIHDIPALKTAVGVPAKVIK